MTSNNLSVIGAYLCNDFLYYGNNDFSSKIQNSAQFSFFLAPT